MKPWSLSPELLPPWRGLADYVARREGAWKGAQNDLVTTDAASPTVVEAFVTST